MQKSVTVVVPVYNGEKYLDEMLKSLLYQSCRPQQILLSDDASTDRSLEIIHRWRKIYRENAIDARIFRHRHNVGLSRNVACIRDYIIGDYVFFADQDDVWNERKIEKQIQFLEKYPDDMICFCNRAIIDREGMLVRRQEKEFAEDILSTGHQDFVKIIQHRANCPFNTMALRNRNLDIILDVPDRICEQDTYITVMSSTFGKIGFLKESLVYYRIHDNNLSGNYFLQMSHNLWKCYWKLVYKNRRYNYKISVDGELIRQRLLEKRGICLENYENGLLGLAPKRVYKDAWLQLKNEMKQHRIGAWK